MNRRDTVLALIALGAAPLAVKAQQAAKVSDHRLRRESILCVPFGQCVW